MTQMKTQMTQMLDRDELNALSQKIIGLAFEVHNQLGPGFVEKIYSEALTIELQKSAIRFTRENVIAVHYKGNNIGNQRLDFLVEDALIVEIKSTDSIAKIHCAQLLSYLKALNKCLGLILNFGSTKLEIKRIVNKF